MQGCGTLMGEWGWGRVGCRGTGGERGFLCGNSPEEAAGSAALTGSPPGTTWADPPSSAPPPPPFWAAGPQVQGLTWLSTSWTFVFFPAKLLVTYTLHASPRIPASHSLLPPYHLLQAPRPGLHQLCSGSEAPAAHTRQISSWAPSSSAVLTSRLAPGCISSPRLIISGASWLSGLHGHTMVSTDSGSGPLRSAAASLPWWLASLLLPSLNCHLWKVRAT